MLFTFVLGCSGEKNEGSAISFEDYAGDTGTQKDSLKSDSLEQVVFTEMISLIQKVQNSYDTIRSNLGHPIDRFNFSTTEKITFIGKNEVNYGKSSKVTPVADFYYYTFSDTNKTISAFYNYLDILSNNGEVEAVKLNEDLESIKSPPLFLAVFDTVIISAEYQCEHAANNWKPFQDSIKKVYGTNYRYWIDVECGGPLKWK